MFATDLSMDVASLARAAEERGFDSVWIPEHTHIPTSRLTPPPMGGAQLPEEYRRAVDPLVALAAAATATDSIHLGTGVLLPAQREPIVTAKAIATLANLAGGRLELGIGFGWNADEMADHGVSYRHRREHAREHVLAMQSLWNDEIAEFHGDHVEFAPSWSWPKPTAAVPVLIGGGMGPKMLSHLCEYADGWIPIGGSGLADAIPRYREALDACGRDPDAARIVPFGSEPTDSKLDHFAAIGVTECVFHIPSGRAEDVRAILDEQAGIIERHRG